MRPTTTNKNSYTSNSTIVVQKRAISQMQANIYLDEAASNHHQAIKHHRAGQYEKEAKCTAKKLAHLRLAREARREDFIA